jgi:membrane-associated phospholipid phosphatase
LVFLFPQTQPGFGSHLFFRLGVILFLFILIIRERKRETALLRFIHLFYPLLLITYLFGETAWFHPLFFSKPFDPWLQEWDKILFGFEPSISFSNHFSDYWISEVLNFSYFSYYFMTIGVALAFYFRYPKQTEKVVFIIVTSFFIYYLFFIAFPSQGPKYYFSAPLNQPIHSGIFSHWVQTVEHYGDRPTGAFPSSHVGMALVYLFLSWRRIPWVFWLLFPFALLICLATVYIKAHYAVDVIGGLISAPLVYWLSIWFYKKMG